MLLFGILICMLLFGILIYCNEVIPVIIDLCKKDDINGIINKQHYNDETTVYSCPCQLKLLRDTANEPRYTAHINIVNITCNCKILS